MTKHQSLRATCLTAMLYPKVGKEQRASRLMQFMSEETLFDCCTYNKKKKLPRVDAIHKLRTTLYVYALPTCLKLRRGFPLSEVTLPLPLPPSQLCVETKSAS